jgi:hypothetical protein
MALGKISHFLPIVMSAINNPKTGHRYLYLNSIREIILNDSQALETETGDLTTQLLNLSNHPEERIRTLVAECLGSLFSAYPIDMQTDLQEVLMGKDARKIATVARSFMYSGKKITGDLSDDAFADCGSDLVGLIEQKDRDIKWFALEGLLTICKTKPSIMMPKLKDLVHRAFSELNVRTEFITEIALPDNTT